MIRLYVVPPSGWGEAPTPGEGGYGVAVEVSGHLVVPPVFNTGEAEHLGLAGSIPVHLRHDG